MLSQGQKLGLGLGLGLGIPLLLIVVVFLVVRYSARGSFAKKLFHSIERGLKKKKTPTTTGAVMAAPRVSAASTAVKTVRASSAAKVPPIQRPTPTMPPPRVNFHEVSDLETLALINSHNGTGTGFDWDSAKGQFNTVCTQFSHPTDPMSKRCDAVRTQCERGNSAACSTVARCGSNQHVKGGVPPNVPPMMEHMGPFQKPTFLPTNPNGTCLGINSNAGVCQVANAPNQSGCPPGDYVWSPGPAC